MVVASRCWQSASRWTKPYCCCMLLVAATASLSTFTGLRWSPSLSLVSLLLVAGRPWQVLLLVTIYRCWTSLFQVAFVDCCSRL